MAIEYLVFVLQTAILEKPTAVLLLLSVIVPLLYILTNEWVRRATRVPGLSGPSGFLVIGNLWQIRVNAAEKYREWSKKYGGVYQVQLGNVPVVVVNTAAAAKALFGQNAQALSSRPEFYTFHKVNNIPYCF
jgi:3-hydroxyphenylacetate 6-hydroxylase